MSHRVHAAPAGLVLAAAIHGSTASGSARPLVASPGVGIDFAKLAGLQEGPPPWKANADSLLRARLDRLDLPVLSAEQFDYHLHVHLDVSIRGDARAPERGYRLRRPVPDRAAHARRDGRPARRVGVEPARGPRHGCAYLGGKPYTGDPASIVLREHEEIVLAYGAKAQLPRPLPARYAFAVGL